MIYKNGIIILSKNLKGWGLYSKHFDFFFDLNRSKLVGKYEINDVKYCSMIFKKLYWFMLGFK